MSELEGALVASVGPVNTEVWLSRGEAASYLRISSVSLAKMAVSGQGPPMYLPSRRVVYRRSDLDQWMVGRRRRHTSEAPHA